METFEKTILLEQTEAIHRAPTTTLHVLTCTEDFACSFVAFMEC